MANINCNPSEVLKFLKRTKNQNKELNDLKEKAVIINVPEYIEVSYVDNYDIENLHQMILKGLERKQERLIKEFEESLRTLNQLVSQGQSYIERKSTLNEIKELEESLVNLRNGNLISNYLLGANIFLEKYRPLAQAVRYINVGVEDYNNSKFEERLDIIEKFLEWGEKHYPLNIKRPHRAQKKTCVHCGAQLPPIPFEEHHNIYCQLCYTLQPQYTTVVSEIDESVPKVIVDESIDNFIRAFIRFQGLQNVTILPELYEKLDEYFLKLGRPTGDQIKKLPLQKNGRRGDTDHQMLWSAFEGISETGYYEHTNLIGKLYWGWELPNLMHLKEKLIENYKKTQKVFHNIPPEIRCRESSLGTQYRLWREFQLVGFFRPPEEFKIAQNDESLQNHHRLWKIMCDDAEDPEIIYIDPDTFHVNY